MARPALQNIDQPGAFKECFDLLQKASTKNFAIKFNGREARCAVNLDHGAFETCLETSSQKPHTRWMNFWGWDDMNRQSVNSIAKSYDVSPRLMGLLCPKLSKASRPSTKTSDKPVEKVAKTSSDHADIEKCLTPPNLLENEDKINCLPQVPSFKSVVGDLWHFCSVDWGERYLYIGFNALFTIPGIEEDATSNRPAGTRIWTSILLCDDGTVLSVFETPDLPPTLLQPFTQRLRQNVLNIFRHLSALHLASDELDSLMKITIRPFGHNPAQVTPTAAAIWESASLLFYYLVDDWITTYSLIAQHEHPYRGKLECHRQAMFQTADVTLIQSLHQLGRQLTVLKLMYQSYESLVTSLLHRQRVMRNSNPSFLSRRYSTPGSLFRKNSSGPGIEMNEGEDLSISDSAMSVRLPPSVIVRFERLVERIKLYALTEIEECLAEKTSLDFMTFNLVQLKESQSVEKLTRTTILLAKATILFLPVSLMTAYFSIQVGDVGELYSLKTYWVCFVIVVVASVVMLFVIGIANGTFKGRSVYVDVTGPLWERVVGKRKMT